MPILTLSPFSVDSVPLRNHCSCSANSRQFCATFPVKDSGSGGLQRIDIGLSTFDTMLRSQLTLNDF